MCFQTYACIQRMRGHTISPIFDVHNSRFSSRTTSTVKMLKIFHHTHTHRATIIKYEISTCLKQAPELAIRIRAFALEKLKTFCWFVFVFHVFFLFNWLTKI